MIAISELTKKLCRIHISLDLKLEMNVGACMRGQAKSVLCNAYTFNTLSSTHRLKQVESIEQCTQRITGMRSLRQVSSRD